MIVRNGTPQDVVLRGWVIKPRIQVQLNSTRADKPT